MTKKSWLVWSLIVLGTLAAGALLVWFLLDSSVEKEPATEQDLANSLPPKIAYRKVASGYEAPSDIASTPIMDDSRLFIVEQKGIIWIQQGGNRNQTPFLDISDKVDFDGEKGLLGLAFHPDYLDNGLFYINYVTESNNPAQKTVISEYKVSDDDVHIADASSEHVLLEYDQPFANHNGGDLNFGPDGYLYIASGDGGGRGDPQNNAQNLNTFLGKILRIDPLGGEGAYGIPEDNPFTGRNNAKKEIWSYGWRNPWRFSFDRETGEMFVGDVGQNTYEEINREPPESPGLNYGWNCMEGDQRYEPESCSDSAAYVSPYVFYPHEGENCTGSVTGGYVYRGQENENLQGYYIYADYCQSQLFTVDSTQYTAPFSDDVGNIRITTFGEDAHGEIYFADGAAGDIYKIISN